MSRPETTSSPTTSNGSNSSLSAVTGACRNSTVPALIDYAPLSDPGSANHWHIFQLSVHIIGGTGLDRVKPLLAAGFRYSLATPPHSRSFARSGLDFRPRLRN